MFIDLTLSEAETQIIERPQQSTELPAEPIQQAPSSTVRSIEIIGKKTGPNACDYCKAADQEISEKKAVKEGTVAYKFTDIDTDEGETSLQEAGLSRRKGVHMPVIKDCTEPSDKSARPACKVYEGFESSDFYDLDNWTP